MSSRILTFEERARVEEDLYVLGQLWREQHPQCIGCGKFLCKDSHWNQCGDCDTREPGEMR